MDENINSVFENRLRVRVMGIHINNDKILMVNHRGLNDSNELWLPPGGGVEFGEEMKEALKKEFMEEVNLAVEVGALLFVHELIKERIHAIELFFEIRSHKGVVEIGRDPELGSNQIITDVRYFSISDIQGMKPDRIHGALAKLNSFDELIGKRSDFHLRSIH